MKKTKKKALVAVIVTMSMIVSACSFNMDRAKKAFDDLGDDLNTALKSDDTETVETSTPDVVEDVGPDIDVPTVVEPTDIPEPTATPAPTATPTPSPVPTSTPIPTPTPMPERVDMSELAEDTIGDGITVLDEQFRESYVMDNTDEIACFEGNRMIISSEEDAVSIRVVNLYLDSVYAEAEGLYRSNLDTLIAAYMLENGTLLEGTVITLGDEDVEEVEEDVDEEVDVEDEADEEPADEFQIYDRYLHSVVNYKYSTNGRILFVQMSYEVTLGDSVIGSCSENMIFDLYTGQIISEDMLIADAETFNQALVAALMEVAPEESRDRDLTNVNYVIATNDDGETFIVASGTINGDVIRAILEIDENSQLFTRYGRIALK